MASTLWFPKRWKNAGAQNSFCHRDQAFGVSGCDIGEIGKAPAHRLHGFYCVQFDSLKRLNKIALVNPFFPDAIDDHFQLAIVVSPREFELTVQKIFHLGVGVDANFVSNHVKCPCTYIYNDFLENLVEKNL